MVETEKFENGWLGQWGTIGIFMAMKCGADVHGIVGNVWNCRYGLRLRLRLGYWWAER